MHQSMSIVNYHLESFYCCILFLEQQYFLLSLVSEIPWLWLLVIQFQQFGQSVSGMSYILWSGPYFKSDIICYSHGLYTNVARAYFAGSTDHRSNVLQLVYISLFSFGSLQNTLTYDRQRNMDINILYCHQLTLSMFNKLYRCFLQQWDLAVCFSWANYCIINSLGFLWISMLPFQPTVQLGGTLSPNCKLYLMTRFG